MVLLSVVVPVHNVERYLAACLDSIAVQSLTDLEVVLVDDGSTDASTRIAEDFCARDRRFRLLHQANAGAGPARNRGVADARGEYLAFVDSDDLLHRRMYELLVGSLRRSGSDFAVSRASRFSNLGQTPSMLHELAMSTPENGTHIDRRPSLVLDRMIWNTVYRRSFWDRAAADGSPLTYRAMMLQDYPVSLQAHVAASAVDVLSECLYYWRERDGGDLSLTQRSNELAHVRDRFTSANLVLDIAEPRLPQALPLLRRHLLEVDVHAISGAMTTMAGADRAAALYLARRLVERLGPDAGASSPAFYRVQAAMVEAGDDALLAELHEHARLFGRSTPVLRTRGLVRRRWYEVLPGFDRLPPAPYRHKGGAPRAVATLADAHWAEEGGLVVEAVVRGTRADGGNVVTVVPEVSSSGFVGVSVPFGPDGDLPIGGPATARTRHLPARHGAGVVVQPQFRDGVFGYAVLRPFAKVDELAAVDGSLRVTGRLLRGQQVGRLLVGEHAFGVAAGGDQFTALVPADALLDAPGHLDQLGIVAAVPVRLEVDGTPRVLVLPPSVAQAAVVLEHRMLVGTRSTGGVLELTGSRVAPVLHAVAWSGPTTLRFEASWAGPQKLPSEVQLEHFERPGEGAVVPVAIQPDGAGLAFEVDVAALPRAEQPYLGPDPDPWHLVFRFADHVNLPVLDRTRAASYAAPRDVGGHRVELVVGRNDVVRLLVSPA